MVFRQLSYFSKHITPKNYLLRSFASSSSIQRSNDYLTLEIKENGVAIARLDDKSSKVNTLSAKMTKEMAHLLNTVETNSKIKSVVLISSKANCFIAGADISQLQACKTKEEILLLSKEGQKFMNQIASSEKPFLAAINGSCMGGGLEVALACHYRLATENKKTILSLPEVKLGLLPGAGGTQRLPQLIGLQAALDMMLTGKDIRPSKAKKIGLVNELCDENSLEKIAIEVAEKIASGSLKSKKKKKNWMNKILEDTPLRSIIFKKAREMVTKLTDGHYPAPFKILETVEYGINNNSGTNLTKGLEKEAENFAQLGMTNEAKSLMSIFFGQNALKKNRFGKVDNPIQSVGVIGAGLMGAGIAQISAQRGIKVLLKDRNISAASKGENMIRSNLINTFLKKKKKTLFEIDQIMANVYPLSDEDNETESLWKKHFKNADLVIEAVFEDLVLKKKLIQNLEKDLNIDSKSNMIFATNTSALSVEDIATASKKPENVIGMHYFSPVPQMPLLEIITHPKTSKETMARAIDLGIRQGKTCILVKDVPGFYVNRCLGPYIAETLSLVQERVDPMHLDTIIKKWGLPVGPITLADEVGIDIASHVNHTLSKALGVRMLGGNPAIFKDMIDKNYLGKKTGKGFYIHPKSKKENKTVNPDALELIKKYLKGDEKDALKDDELIINRLICRFVNEAILCVQDNIIASPSEGDMGAIFGIGFAPFRGGPFRYVDTIGSTKYNDMMLKFADKYGEQFSPCQMLQDYAKTNKKFHN